MRILHAASLLNPPDGIIKQMKWEDTAAKKLNIDWSTKLFCPPGTVSDDEILVFTHGIKQNKLNRKMYRAISWAKLRYQYYKWLLTQESEYDIIILRYYVHDPFQYLFAKKFQKPLVFLHHTKEGPELGSTQKLPGLIRMLLENFIAKHTLKYASGIVGVTSEIIDYELQRTKFVKSNTIFPNGIDTDQIKAASDHRTDQINLLFIATKFYPWQGLDLLLNSIKKSSDQFTLHLVGEIPKDIIETIENDSRILNYGKLCTQQIYELACRCDLGLSSFALNRKNMTQACTLKVREYLALGLPVYLGHDETIPKTFNFVKKGPANIDEIIEYAYSMKNAKRQDVIDTAKLFIDKKILVKNFYNWILSEFRDKR